MEKKDLLFSVTKKDLKVQTFQSGGPGGQHQNKTSTGVRISHPESGAVAECRETRSQSQNKRIAFTRLADDPKFKNWCRIKASQIIRGKTLDQIVEEMMNPKNLKFEVLSEEGKWTEWEDWFEDEKSNT